MRSTFIFAVLILAGCGTAEAGLLVPGEGDAPIELIGSPTLEMIGWGDWDAEHSKSDLQESDGDSRGLSGSPTNGLSGFGSVSAILGGCTSLIDPREIERLQTHNCALPPPPEFDGLIKPPQHA